MEIAIEIIKVLLAFDIGRRIGIIYGRNHPKEPTTREGGSE